MKVFIVAAVLLLFQEASAQQSVQTEKQRMLSEFYSPQYRMDSMRVDGSEVFNRYVVYDLPKEDTRTDVAFVFDANDEVKRIETEVRNIDSAVYFKELEHDMKIVATRTIDDRYEVKGQAQDFDILIVYHRSRRAITTSAAKTGMLDAFNEWK